MFPYAPINEFTPDGRLRQVDYASKASESKNTVVGVVGKNCVVLISFEKQNPLVVRSSSSTMHRIDDGITAAFSGLSGDARPLVHGAQQKVMKKKFEYGESPDANQVARMVGHSIQEATMMAHSRPFGVSVLIGGASAKPELIKISTDGSIESVKAGAIGRLSNQALEFLETSYNVDSLENETETIKLALKAVRKIDVFSADDVEIGVLTAGSYKLLTQVEKQTVIESIF